MGIQPWDYLPVFMGVILQSCKPSDAYTQGIQPALSVRSLLLDLNIVVGSG